VLHQLDPAVEDQGTDPGNIQDQVGQGSEQPDLVSGVPACCGGVGLDDLWGSLPTQNFL